MWNPLLQPRDQQPARRKSKARPPRRRKKNHTPQKSRKRRGPSRRSRYRDHARGPDTEQLDAERLNAEQLDAERLYAERLYAERLYEEPLYATVVEHSEPPLSAQNMITPEAHCVWLNFITAANSTSAVTVDPNPPQDQVAETPVEECKICTVNKRCIAFQPCGHLQTCVSCSQNLKLCPICRGPIKSKIQVFI